MRVKSHFEKRALLCLGLGAGLMTTVMLSGTASASDHWRHHHHWHHWEHDGWHSGTTTTTVGNATSTTIVQTTTTMPMDTTTTAAPTTTTVRRTTTTTVRSTTTTSTTAAPSGSTTAPIGMGGTWSLKFDDEMSASSLDTSKWTVGWFGSGITNEVNSAENDCYDPANVSQSGGSLNLAITNKTETCGGKSHPYAGSLVSTNGKFTYTYGAMEVRAYLPAASNGVIANWPAIWTDGTGNWPATGEDDIMEGLGGTAAYHFHSPSGGPGNDVSGNFTGWHTFASDWEPGKVTYYYDGKNVGSISSGITSSPMYLILTNCTPNGPEMPATMQVDYVRVWSKG